jgi:hypothetical protein
MTRNEDLHIEALKKAPPDSWIAFSDEDQTKIVAVGATYEEARNKSESAGVSNPVLVKTPKAQP